MSVGLVSEQGGKVAWLSKTRCKTLSSQPQKFHTAIAQTTLSCRTAHLITEGQSEDCSAQSTVHFCNLIHLLHRLCGEVVLVGWGTFGYFWYIGALMCSTVPVTLLGCYFIIAGQVGTLSCYWSSPLLCACCTSAALVPTNLVGLNFIELHITFRCYWWPSLYIVIRDTLNYTVLPDDPPLCTALAPRRLLSATCSSSVGKTRGWEVGRRKRRRGRRKK